MEPMYKDIFVKRITLCCHKNKEAVEVIMRASRALNCLRFKKIIEAIFMNTPDPQLIDVVNEIINTNIRTMEDVKKLRRIIERNVLPKAKHKNPPNLPVSCDKDGNFIFN
jgi:hypothetical protein